MVYGEMRPISAQITAPPFSIPVLPTLPPAGKKCGQLVAISNASGFSFYVWDCVTNTWVSIVYNGFCTPVYPVLPPAPVGGNTYITVNTGATFNTYIWNPVSNQWVQITNNNYVQYPGGPDITTDDVGPITYTNFGDPNQWMTIQNNAFFTATVPVAGLELRSVASVVGQNTRSWFGLLSRRRLIGNNAGNIEIEFFFDNVAVGLANVTHSFDLACVLTTQADTAVKIGMRKENANPNGIFVQTDWSYWTASTDALGASLACGAPVTSFKMRFIVQWYLVAATVGYWVNRPLIQCSFNGGVYGAIGGVGTGATFQNSIVGMNPGFSWGFGMYNRLADWNAAQYFGRLTQVTIHQGKLLGY